MYSGDENHSDEITSGSYDEVEGKDEEMTFEGWMDKIDQIVSVVISTSIHDLPNMDFRLHYDHECTPEEFCADILGIEDGELIDPGLFAKATDL